LGRGSGHTGQAKSGRGEGRHAHRQPDEDGDHRGGVADGGGLLQLSARAALFDPFDPPPALHVRPTRRPSVPGIAHTRWATHGAPASHNAHPHFSPTEENARIALVHNGIIENHDELRAELTSLGYVFTSQTDTEVIAHQIGRAHV